VSILVEDSWNIKSTFSLSLLSSVTKANIWQKGYTHTGMEAWHTVIAFAFCSTLKTFWMKNPPETIQLQLSFGVCRNGFQDPWRHW
jgi:thiosulfate reductase cytochrome b subunit